MTLQQVQQLTNLQAIQQVRLQPLQIHHALGNQQAEATTAVQTLAEVAAAQGADVSRVRGGGDYLENRPRPNCHDN